MESLRLPSVRNRFVTRAAYLKTHRPFIQATDDAVIAWNGSHTKFAISSRAGDPQTSQFSPPYFHPYLLKHNQPVRRADPGVYYSAMNDWMRLVDRVCLDWWPSTYYPNWLGSHPHPATMFASACLVWEPIRVPEDWIIKAVVGGPIITGYDVENPFQDWQASFERDQLNAFHERLDSLFESQISVTKVDVDRLRHEIANDYLRAINEHSMHLQRRHSVSVFPGMKKADWDAMWPYVEEGLKPHASSDDGLLPFHVRCLSKDGMSKKAIADLLGIDRREVYRYLEDRG